MFRTGVQSRLRVVARPITGKEEQMRRASLIGSAMSLLLASALAMPVTAQDDPDIDATSLEGWCVANSPDDPSLGACREAAQAMLASRDGVSSAASEDMLGGVLDDASAIFDATVEQIDLSGAEDVFNEAGRAVGEAIDQIDPAAAVSKVGRLLDEVVSKIDLESAGAVIAEAGKLSDTVASWIAEHPEELCALGATGVGWLARASVSGATGDPDLARMAFDEAAKTAESVCGSTLGALPTPPVTP